MTPDSAMWFEAMCIGSMDLGSGWCQCVIMCYLCGACDRFKLQRVPLQLIHDINNIIPNTNLSIQLLLMSDEIITNTHQNIRHKLCAITGKYLVDVLHNRTRAIYSSQNEQANEINDDQSQHSSDLQSKQSTILQHTLNKTQYNTKINYRNILSIIISYE